MAQVRNVRPGYTVIHPNREKAKCKITRLIIVALLLASVFLIVVITVGGSSELAGMKPVNIVWCLVYIALAVYILTRWSRGLLPIAALFSILLLIMVVVSTFGMAGTSWFNRNQAGFASAQSIFGGGGLSSPVLGTLTAIMIPVQIALIVFAMIGFAQGWNVEEEVPEEEAKRRGSKTVASGPQAATA